MKTAVYARKSTNKIGQQETIENQVKICTRSAKEFDLTIVDIKQDSATGTDDNNRPAVKELIKDAIKGKYDCVIMKGISRLYRKTSKGLELVERLDQNNIRVVLVEEHFDSFASENRTGTGKLDLSRLTMYLMFAEMESSKTADRVKYTQLEKAYAGEWNQPSSVPFGYKYDPKTKKLDIDYSKAEIVRLIFKLYLDGLGMRSISQYLNGDNEKEQIFPSPKAKRWSQYTIGFMLKNQVYIGDVVYNKRSKTSRPYKNPEAIGKTDDDIYIGNDYNDKSEWIVTKNAHTAIIDKDTFQRVQETIKKKGIRTGIRSNTSLLASIAKCGKCGTGMTFKRGNKDKNGRIRTKSNYYCADYIKYGKRYCTSHHLGAKELEEFVINELQKDLESRLSFDKIASDVKKEKKDTTSPIERNIVMVEKDIQQVSSKMDKLLEKNVEGKITDRQFEMMNEKYSNELDLLTEQLTELKLSHKKVSDNKADQNYLIKKYEDVKNMQEYNIEKQRYILLDLIKKVEVNDGKVDIYFAF